MQKGTRASSDESVCTVHTHQSPFFHGDGLTTSILKATNGLEVGFLMIIFLRRMTRMA